MYFPGKAHLFAFLSILSFSMGVLRIDFVCIRFRRGIHGQKKLWSHKHIMTVPRKLSRFQNIAEPLERDQSILNIVDILPKSLVDRTILRRVREGCLDGKIAPSVGFNVEACGSVLVLMLKSMRVLKPVII